MPRRHEKASKASIDKVLAIAARRGYVPSAAARSLVGKSSRFIGVMLPGGDDGNVLDNPYAANVVGVIERLLRQRGYDLLLRGIPDPAAVPAAIRTWNLDAAIFIGFLDSTIQEMSDGLAIPLVALVSHTTRTDFMNVHLDDRKGGLLATKHLIGNGHRHIAFVGPLTIEQGVVHERHRGYEQAMDEAGLVTNRDLSSTLGSPMPKASQ